MREEHRIKPKLAVLLAASLLGLVSTQAHAADWRLTAVRQTQFGLSLSFLDVQSIRGGNGEVRFSTLTFFSRQTRKMNRASAVVAANCPSKAYRFQQIVLFRNQRALSEWHSTAMSIALPQSNIFDAISAACGISDFGMHVEGVEQFAAQYFKKWPQRGQRPT